ncbi:hypothetical protein [Croceicoccus sp. BE223]|uniref:hypothetical protein n=1 Tax=Croceicoccus sp. BE223 TaxID=2817716 RepID=UPI0028559452|nr:hypothetical protein [Croceicoccus sp. BE223]MDR7101186.1 hypothetical protein [Croceicoccus sp. BE223]
MTEEIDWIARAGKRAKGKRPQYFEDPAVERLMSITMALAAELSVQRQRGDTLERILEDKGVIDRAEIDAWRPSREAAQERGVATKAYIARIMRGVQQAAEAMKADDKAMDVLSKELRES